MSSSAMFIPSAVEGEESVASLAIDVFFVNTLTSSHMVSITLPRPVTSSGAGEVICQVRGTEGSDSITTLAARAFDNQIEIRLTPADVENEFSITLSVQYSSPALS